MQKRARLRFDVNLLAGAPHAQRVERLDRRQRLTFGGAKRRKIVLSCQMLRAHMHCISVKCLRHVPHAPAFQHRRRTAVQDTIEIVARAGRKTRVEIRCCGFGLQHANGIGAQVVIECVAQL